MVELIRATSPLAEAAARWRDWPEAVCIVGGGFSEAALKKHIAGRDDKIASDNPPDDSKKESPHQSHAVLLPQVVSFNRLFAAAHLEGASADNLLTLARLGSPPPIGEQLTADIHRLLPENVAAGAAVSLARSLAAVFEEFMQEQPSLLIAKNAMPDLLAAMEGRAGEADFLGALWDCLADGRLFRARQVLADFCENAPPLLMVADKERPPWHNDFFQRCANGIAVVEAEDGGEEKLWAQLKSGEPADACPPTLKECRQGTAASLHQTAAIALEVARDFLQYGDVGIAVYDRLLARRLRAVAEADGMRIQDDGGWRMETLSFGGALRQWTQTAMEDFSAANFSRMLLAPYFSQQAKQRAVAEEEWRRLLAGNAMPPQSWEEVSRVRGGEHYAAFADSFLAARRAMPNIAPLSAWVKWLLKYSAAAMAGWKNDSAAVGLRASLRRAGDENHRTTAADFRAWLDWRMSEETGGESAASPVCFVSPFSERRFESLILLGATADNLPAAADSFMGEKSRRQLQLPDRDRRIKKQWARFWRLLSSPSRAAAVWRHSEKSGHAPSPFWTLLADSFRARGGEVQIASAPSLPPPAAGLSPPSPAFARMQKLPQKISITAAGRLMKCPYHFFMSDALSLSDADGDEDLGDLARGSLLHERMKKLFESGGDSDESMASQWEIIFGGGGRRRPGAFLYLEHWRQNGGAFLEEEAARRREGWRAILLEHSLSARLPLSGGEVELRGRIDRVDCKTAKADSLSPVESESKSQEKKQFADCEKVAVVDYKTGEAPKVGELQCGEDPQTPLYAFLLGCRRADWRIVCPVKSGRPAEVQNGGATRVAARLRAAARQIAAGAPLPANGNAAACSRCSSRRLCRRDHWRLSKK